MRGMGHNTRDRGFEEWVRRRRIEVQRLAERGRALQLLVTAAVDFQDRAFVYRLLDRIHDERGIARITVTGKAPLTRIATQWAESRERMLKDETEWKALADVNGVVVFGGGTSPLVERAEAADIVVWRVLPRPRPAPQSMRAPPDRKSVV